jgi:type II secretory pathway component PulJ
MKKVAAQFLQRGQTIIEVLIATVVVALVMTAIAAALTSSLRNTAESKFRSYASSYAQQAMEVFIRERSLLGWQQFTEATLSGVFCLNELPADTEAFLNMPVGACTESVVYSGTDFFREANVTVVNADEIRVEVLVEWQDSGRERQVRVTQEFRNR